MSDDMIRDSMRAIGELAPVEMPSAVPILWAVASASGLRGAQGTLFLASLFQPSPYDLVVADYDLRPIGPMVPYLSSVFSHLESLRANCKTLHDPVVYVEPAGIGNLLLTEGYHNGFNMHAIREDIVELDFAERIAAGAGAVHMRKVRLTAAPYERIVNFRGTAANHLRRQMQECTRETTADDCELLNALLMGTLEALTLPP